MSSCRTQRQGVPRMVMVFGLTRLVRGYKRPKRPLLASRGIFSQTRHRIFGPRGGLEAIPNRFERSTPDRGLHFEHREQDRSQHETDQAGHDDQQQGRQGLHEDLQRLVDLAIEGIRGMDEHRFQPA